MNNDVTFELYNYQLPTGAIAQQPASPRDACKLLIYDTRTETLSIDRFHNVGHYLPEKAFLVMNNTEVVPARLYCSSKTKKRIEVFMLVNELQPGETEVRCMVDRKINVGETLWATPHFSFLVVSQDRQYFMLKPNFPLTQLQTLLKKQGTTPIPKYIKETSLTERSLRRRYQTVFAEHTHKPTHSVAAPTASLHFTKPLLSQLKKRKVDQVMLTLHVGLGTFAPIKEDNIQTKKLFNEYYEVPTKSSVLIHKYKQESRPLIAVGTTAVRTLESYARTPEFANKQSHNSGTDLFIFPPYRFKLVDGLITNFHLPNSSLMMLVDALLQSKKAKRPLKEIYEFALKNDFKFYSFGDAMMVV